MALTKKFLWSCLKILTIFLTAVILLIAALYLYLSSIAYSRSPVDANRFSTNRQYLSKDLPIDEIVPIQVGEFMRKELTNEVSTLNYERELLATYENENGQRVDLAAYLDTNHADDRAFLARRSGCGDCVASTPVVHTDTNVAYGYGFCGCMFYAHHQFRWINGDWQLSASAASTQKGDGETLLAFLSSYPF